MVSYHCCGTSIGPMNDTLVSQSYSIALAAVQLTIETIDDAAR
jgi:hypothetical protein